MSNKCKWEDGKFVPCDDFTPEIMVTSSGSLPYCSSCNKTYKKPKTEVIIKQSGGTWVARYDGVDWLYTGISKKPDFWWYDQDSRQPSIKWRPISDITITDEIAKLRPMVVVNYGKEKLYGVGNNYCISDFNKYSVSLCRLATVGDLS